MKRRTFITLCASLILTVLAGAQTETASPRLLSGRSWPEAPFAKGERLVFDVNWKPLFFIPAFKAGEITLSVEESNYRGRDTYRIQAWAASEGALLKVAGIEVRNYFESQIDRRSFQSLRFFQSTREGKRNRDLEMIFDYETDSVQIHEVDPDSDPPRVIRHLSRKGIPGPAVDVISVFYVTRLRSFTPGERFTLDLNERGEFRQVHVGALEEETVDTPVGRYPAIMLTTTGGLFRQGGDFRAWYSVDGRRNPARFEADVRFGRVYGSLIRMDTPQMLRGIVRVP